MMKMACRFYHWCHYFSQRISCLWNTLRFITFFFFFFSFYREATMKSVKSNSFISLAGLIMEFLTMQQACFHLYEESNYLILLVQDLLSSTAGVCRCGRLIFSTAAYVSIYNSFLWSIHHFEVFWVLFFSFWITWFTLQ